MAEKYKLVLIEWQDSFGCSTNWEVIKDEPLNAQPMICQSVGWLVQDDKKVKVVVPHLTKSENVDLQGCGDMTIPTVSVVRIVELKEASRKRR